MLLSNLDFMQNNNLYIKGCLSKKNCFIKVLIMHCESELSVLRIWQLFIASATNFNLAVECDVL